MSGNESLFGRGNIAEGSGGMKSWSKSESYYGADYYVRITY